MNSDREPFSPHDAIDAQQARERKQLTLDYKATFTGTHGAKVLEDLERLFGFTRPSAVAGMRAEDVFLREGMKLPLYHIKRHLAETFKISRPKPKTKTDSSHG